MESHHSRKKKHQMTQQTETHHAVTLPPPLVLMKLIGDYMPARSIGVAAEFGIADQLKDGSKSVSELAESTGTHAPSLYRMLRLLTRIGVFAHHQPECFANTDLSAYLRSDVPGSMYGMARMWGGDPHWRSWGELAHSIRTGQPAFDKAHAMEMWRYFKEQDPEAGAIFDQAMTGFSRSVDLPIVQAYDFSGIRTLLDVGGGHGNLLATILAAYPQIESGILFDQPQVVEEASAQMPTAETAGRIELATGDFFEAVPEGADAYIVKNLLHDWNDDECVRILTNCRKAMRPGGRVLAAELVLQPNRPDPFPYLLDLEMLVMLTGRERTEEEFRNLYGAAGLRVTRVIPTASMYWVIEGVASDT